MSQFFDALPCSCPDFLTPRRMSQEGLSAFGDICGKRDGSILAPGSINSAVASVLRGSIDGARRFSVSI